MRLRRSEVASVLVGFGHAARSFHLPLVRQLHDGPIHVIDPFLSAENTAAHDRLRFARTLPEVRELDPATAVVHVCSPPDTHADVVFTAAELGFRRFVVEKPMATRRADVARLVELDRAGVIDLLVVANWLTSALTDRIRAELAGTAEQVEDVVLRQVKPRVQRSLSDTGHGSAFDVEAPHLVTLALALFDDPGELREASCTDLVVGDQVRRDMGSVRVVFDAPGGHGITLHSDLTAPWRERSTRIRWADGRQLAGFHPCDSNDLYAQLHIMDPRGRLVSRELIHDDTVHRFLTAAYDYFAGTGPKPASDVHFGARVCILLDDIKSVAAAQKQPT